MPFRSLWHEKSAENLVTGVEASVSNFLCQECFLHLGIRFVWGTVAKKLAQALKILMPYGGQWLKS